MKLECFGTLGPSCHDTRRLVRMIETGMTGIRLNLSHGDLESRSDWIESLQEAQALSGQSVLLLADLKGRELRIGDMEPVTLSAEETVIFGRDIPAGPQLLGLLHPGCEIRLDDGKILLQAEACSPDGTWTCTVRQGGILSGRKSVCIPDALASASVLCDEDLRTLDLARTYGVGALMVPFVQTAADLERVRTEMKRRDLHLKLYAKIENEEGVRNLEAILPLADVIVIARGDLGQNLGLIRLPAVQRNLERRCRQAGIPYMVVTQLLASMTDSPVCTRAEANDVFRAVADGASSVMLTNETAAGRYPEEAMATLCALANEGLRERQNPDTHF